MKILAPQSALKVVIRGGGDLATGVVQKFHRAGFAVAILEIREPTAIRRSVALCEAVYDGFAQVEDVTCKKASTPEELDACWRDGVVPLLIDPAGESIKSIKPDAVIDAILAKQNTGTNGSMADVVIALGPGFHAGEDVHAVIETMRGHDLGRLILEGSAKQDTGVPGEIAGESSGRVMHAPVHGTVAHSKRIGDIVQRGETIFTVGGVAAPAPISGLLRGLIREGAQVQEGMKAADIDPRTDTEWRTISDKSRCIGGAALEAYYFLKRR